MTTFVATRLAVALFAVAAVLSSVHAHGFMAQPRQRGSFMSDKVSPNIEPMPEGYVQDYCEHCLNGGGKATVMAAAGNNWKLYEPIKNFRQTAGLCGDAFGSDEHMIGGEFAKYDPVPMAAAYKSGGTADFEVEIDTNHNGYFEFFLCDLDSCGTTDLEAKCFTGGHCQRLMRVAHPDCESGGESMHTQCGPIDDKYPGRWYVPCREGDHVGVHIVGGDNGYMRYQMPDVECKHCVIQWYWATANSCAPRGFLEYFENYNNPFGTTCASDGGGAGAHSPTMSACGGEAVPEEFWTCADTTVTSDGKSAGAVAAVPSATATDGDAPAEDEATPTDDEATPAEDEATPAEDEATPAEDGATTTTAEDEATPAEDEDTSSEGADTGTEEADTGTEEADTRTEEADTRTEEADTRTEEADTRTEEADTRTEEADTGTEEADTRTEEADTGTEEADTRTEEADTGTEEADTGTEEADTGTEEADTGTEEADTGTEEADTRTEEADTGTEEADTRTEEADTGTEEADTRTEEADTGTEEADTGTEEADTGTEEADTGTEEADTRTEEADTRTEEADTSSMDADTSSMEGDTSSMEGDTSSMEGDTSSMESDTSSMESDTSSMEGDTNYPTSGEESLSSEAMPPPALESADSSCDGKGTVAKDAECTTSDDCCSVYDFCVKLGNGSVCKRIFELWNLVDERRA